MSGPGRSIVVLPFVNLSGAPDEYFADGMTEELTTALAGVGGLRVAARTSAFAFKGKGEDVRQIGAALGVRMVLEGSVRRSGRRLRLAVRLTDAACDSTMWAATYDGTRGDVFRLQDSIAHAVVGALRLRLAGGAARPLVRQATRSVEAHELYLQGRAFWNQRSASALRLAVRYFERAVARDSTYAAAYAGLADAYLLFPAYDLSPPLEAYPKVTAAGLRALALDSTLAEAHAVLALGKTRYEWDWPGAEREFRRAIALDPSYATAHQWYAEYLVMVGRPAEALGEVDRALLLDPLSRVISTEKGEVLAWSRRYAEAIAQYRRTLELDPDFSYAHAWLGRAYLANGMAAAAVAELETARRLSEHSYDLGSLAYAYAATGRRDQALAVLRRLTQQAQHAYAEPMGLAQAYTGLHDRARAVAWLERAAQVRDPLLVNAFVDPLFDPLRTDPRFGALVRRVGLAELTGRPRT